MDNITFQQELTYSFKSWILHIREVYGYESFETMYDKATRRFHNGMMSHSNGILKFLECLCWEGEGKERDLIPWNMHFIVTCVFVQWGSWNNSLNWRKVFKCLNFIWQTWYLKYMLFNWCLCPWVFWLPWKPKLFFWTVITAKISIFSQMWWGNITQN